MNSDGENSDNSWFTDGIGFDLFHTKIFILCLNVLLEFEMWNLLFGIQPNNMILRSLFEWVCKTQVKTDHLRNT